MVKGKRDGQEVNKKMSRANQESAQDRKELNARRQKCTFNGSTDRRDDSQSEMRNHAAVCLFSTTESFFSLWAN